MKITVADIDVLIERATANGQNAVAAVLQALTIAMELGEGVENDFARYQIPYVTAMHEGWKRHQREQGERAKWN